MGSGGSGGAILDDNATLTITDSTFVDNLSQGGIGDAIDFAGAVPALLAADIFGQAGSPVAGANQCGGSTPTDDGYNISDDSSCGFTATGSVNDSFLDSFLGSLAANGGPTETVALLPGPRRPPIRRRR